MMALQLFLHILSLIFLNCFLKISLVNCLPSYPHTSHINSENYHFHYEPSTSIPNQVNYQDSYNKNPIYQSSYVKNFYAQVPHYQNSEYENRQYQYPLHKNHHYQNYHEPDHLFANQIVPPHTYSHFYQNFPKVSQNYSTTSTTEEPHIEEQTQNPENENMDDKLEESTTSTSPYMQSDEQNEDANHYSSYSPPKNETNVTRGESDDKKEPKAILVAPIQNKSKGQIYNNDVGNNKNIINASPHYTEAYQTTQKSQHQNIYNSSTNEYSNISKNLKPFSNIHDLTYTQNKHKSHHNNENSAYINYPSQAPSQYYGHFIKNYREIATTEKSPHFYNYPTYHPTTISHEPNGENNYRATEPSTDYSFSYGVESGETGDFKSAVETKQGETVTGQYSFLQPDGLIRLVTYSSHPLTGFNAHVQKINPHSPYSY